MTPLQLNLKCSVIGSILFGLTSAASLAIVLLVALPWLFKLLLSITIIASAVYTVCCYILRLFLWSIIALKINSKNQLHFIRKDGIQFEVSVLQNTTVTAYLTVLNARLLEATFWQRVSPQHVVIFSDDVDAEAYRQLRVWLRWSKVQLTKSLVKSVGSQAT